MHAQVEDEKSGYVIIKNWHENYAKAWDEQECWHRLWLERGAFWERHKPHRIDKLRNGGLRFPDENDGWR